MRSAAAVPLRVSERLVPKRAVAQPPLRSGSFGAPKPARGKSRLPWAPVPPGRRPLPELPSRTPSPSSSPRPGTETVLPVTSNVPEPWLPRPLSKHPALILGRRRRGKLRRVTGWLLLPDAAVVPPR